MCNKLQAARFAGFDVIAINHRNGYNYSALIGDAFRSVRTPVTTPRSLLKGCEVL